MSLSAGLKLLGAAVVLGAFALTATENPNLHGGQGDLGAPGTLRVPGAGE